MSKELKDIFLKDGENMLDLKGWEKFAEKKDFEKNFYSEYFKKDFFGREISIGVFYELEEQKNISKKIHHVAWGYRGEKDCSFNSKILDNKYFENVTGGCPCY